MSKKLIVLVILVILIGASLAYAKSVMQGAAQAYLYGYPIVVMDETRKSMQVGYPETNKRVNHFTHVRVFPDHNFRNVVRPNVDTLYSIAWLDLSKEPLILTVPEMQGHYYVMPFMDAWTNVFASVGSRETGSQAGKYFITGPNWAGKNPDNMQVIQAPTDMLWLIGRIQTNGLSDIPLVASLQSGFNLQTLSDLKNNSKPISYLQSNSGKTSDIDPYKIVDKLSAIEFFDALSKLINTQGTLTEDKAAIENLENLGLNLSIEKDTYLANPVKSWLMNKAFGIAKKKIKERLTDRSDNENGWMVRRSGIGRYGNNYPIRAAVAMIGLGALAPEEAVYPNATVDSDNEVLSGKYKYKIHFPAGELPPVDAFWSLTMYDENGYLIESTINRYAIGDRDNLKFNTDGSLDIFIQHEKPKINSSNWLPSPKGEFAVTLRLYLPKKEFLNGDWKLPPLIRFKN